MQNNKSNDTSWQKVSKWYNKIVGEDGHYFHQQIVIPNLQRILDIGPTDKLLDLACGQGILARSINENAQYVGLDLSTDLINSARNQDRNPKHKFYVNDISKEIDSKDRFNKAAIVLAIQNIRYVDGVFKNVNNLLDKNGKLVIVMNHPAFRIPRHSFWEIDNVNKTQKRSSDTYMSRLEIPIMANPGLGDRSERTWSFHMPISEYTKLLKNNGFVIEDIEEWVSDKTSTGGAARMENRARKEFPMFMTIIARKI